MDFPPNQGLDQDEVTEEVEQVLEENEIVLFMKGTALMPQCGYSRKALGLIDHHRDEYETVDVLESLDEYRTALNEHSAGRRFHRPTSMASSSVGRTFSRNSTNATNSARR